MPSSISSTLFQPMKAPCFVEFLGLVSGVSLRDPRHSTDANGPTVNIKMPQRMLCSSHFRHVHYDFLRYDAAAAIHCTISGWCEGHGMWKQSVFDP